jgi:hypothetical protein
LQITKIEIGGHAACTGERRGAYRVEVEKSMEKRPLGRPGVDGTITLKRILTLSLLMYEYGAPCKARNFNVYIYIWTYVWQR